MKAYRPVELRITQSEAPHLYETERALVTAVPPAACAWLAFVGFSATKDLWTRGIPQALYQALDSFQQDSAEAAAAAFLEMRGYTVSKVQP